MAVISHEAVMRNRLIRRILIAVALVFTAGFLWAESLVIPVKGATSHDWNKKSFWAEPWGKSGVHKGIDIFAKLGTPLLSASCGVVLFRGERTLGGKVLLVLGPKWRLHYYSHLSEATAGIGDVVFSGKEIGRVGDSGNAKGKPPHLHYSVITLMPYLWRWDSSSQGWKEIFFLNPGEVLPGKN